MSRYMLHAWILLLCLIGFVASPVTEARATANSRLLAPPSATQAQALTYLAGRSPRQCYSAYDRAAIVQLYWREAAAVGIDPALALAQSIHETSDNDGYNNWPAWCSWWAKRPHRNPAGLGVTGETRATCPNRYEWSWNPHTGRCHKGLSFPTWQAAVRAHLGRLLLYALPPSASPTPAQADLLREALAWRSFPVRLRGTAPTLLQLGAAHNPTGSGWAVPGTRYGQRIAAVASAIQHTRSQ